MKLKGTLRASCVAAVLAIAISSLSGCGVFSSLSPPATIAA